MMRIPVEKIGFDFDGVIADIGENFIRMACEEHDYCSFTLEDITSFDVEGSLAMPEEVIHKIFNDILHDSLATGLKPLPGAKQTIEDMAAVGRVNVITARPLLEPMQAWFEEYFAPDVNSRLNLIAAGHPDEKGPYIHDLGLQYFVDDRAETCHLLARESITPFVFEQPWNRARHQFTSVRGWDHLRELLLLESLG